MDINKLNSKITTTIRVAVKKIHIKSKNKKHNKMKPGGTLQLIEQKIRTPRNTQEYRQPNQTCFRCQ